MSIAHFSETIFKKVFDQMVSDYSNIFMFYYPSHRSIGFTERNLALYLVKNILTELRINENIPFAWMEAPLPVKNNHIDSIVISPGHNSIFYIEAKRINVSAKKNAIYNDVERLISKENRDYLVENYTHKTKIINEYIVYIADVWLECPWKREVPKWWTGSSTDSFVSQVKEKTGFHWCSSNQLVHSFTNQDFVDSALCKYALLLGYQKVN